MLGICWQEDGQLWGSPLGPGAQWAAVGKAQWALGHFREPPVSTVSSQPSGGLACVTGWVPLLKMVHRPKKTYEAVLCPHWGPSGLSATTRRAWPGSVGSGPLSLQAFPHCVLSTALLIQKEPGHTPPPKPASQEALPGAPFGRGKAVWRERLWQQEGGALL